LTNTLDDLEYEIFKSRAYEEQNLNLGKQHSSGHEVEQFVVQEYLRDPYLIDGLKFDIRLYVLILGADPMRVYLFQEGLVRFAT